MQNNLQDSCLHHSKPLSVTCQSKTKDRALIKMVARCYARERVKKIRSVWHFILAQSSGLRVEVALMALMGSVAAVGCCEVAERDLSEVRRGVITPDGRGCVWLTTHLGS